MSTPKTLYKKFELFGKYLGHDVKLVLAPIVRRPDELDGAILTKNNITVKRLFLDENKRIKMEYEINYGEITMTFRNTVIGYRPLFTSANNPDVEVFALYIDGEQYTEQHPRLISNISVVKFLIKAIFGNTAHVKNIQTEPKHDALMQ